MLNYLETIWRDRVQRANKGTAFFNVFVTQTSPSRTDNVQPQPLAQILRGGPDRYNGHNMGSIDPLSANERLVAWQ